MSLGSCFAGLPFLAESDPKRTTGLNWDADGAKPRTSTMVPAGNNYEAASASLLSMESCAKGTSFFSCDKRCNREQAPAARQSFTFLRFCLVWFGKAAGFRYTCGVLSAYQVERPRLMRSKRARAFSMVLFTLLYDAELGRHKLA